MARSHLPDHGDLARALDRTTDLSRLPDSYPRRTALDVALGLLIALFLAAGFVLAALFVADAAYGALQSYQRATGIHVMRALSPETLTEGTK